MGGKLLNNNMVRRFGNISLGEINEMLISFIGKDMYLSFWQQVNPKESLEAYKKRLYRLFKEEDNSDFTVLCRTDDNSIVRFVFEKIIPILKNDYSLSDSLISYLGNFVSKLYKKFTTNETPILESCLNYDEIYDSSFLEKSQHNYKVAFEKIETKYESLKKLREKFPNEDTIKNVINAMKSRGDNPSWSILKQLLDKVKDDKQITALLIDAYIMRNIYDTLQGKVKTDSIIDVQYFATDCINFGIQFFFVDYGYKKYETTAKDILKLIEQSTTHASEFYCNWFRGFTYVAKGELKQAKDYYKKAFAARRFAGCQFEKFIKQAFALSCYTDFNADKVRDSADPNSDSKSPLSSDAKKYWNYGYAAGVFEQKAEETHLILFHRTDNFLLYFSPRMFPENSPFYKQLIPEMGFATPMIDDENTFNNEYNKLNQLSEKDINKRIKYSDSHPTKNLPIIVAISYINNCYHFGYTDLAQKFIVLLNNWLTNFSNLDFSIVSDKGCSIACDAIQQYKELKLHITNIVLIELKKNVLKIIEKSDEESLSKNSLKLKRSALQEAIESCDMDIVKAIVEKIDDIDSLRISADEVSPIYYAINRYVDLYRYIHKIELSPAEIAKSAIKYENLDVPGFTEEDKIRYMNALENKVGKEVINAVKEYEKWKSYGKKELWESELVDIQNICLYLIEHTKDQDGYYKTDKDIIFTSLLYAAESNNAKICRHLIKHNADPNQNFPFTFLYRCIYWNSWNVLAMFLEEFPEKAKNDILKQPQQLLFKFLQKTECAYKDMGKDYVERIVELFKQYWGNR